MKITLDALKTLEVIERCGTFALAAQELCRVPSALTYTVNTLENQLNAKIFDRTGHRAKLTPTGKLILKEGKKLLNSASQFEKSIQLHQSGWEETVTIAYDRLIPFNNLLFLIDEFYQECPAGVQLKWSGEILGGCWDALYSYRADLAIGVTGDPPEREDISMMELGHVEFIYVVCANHPFAKKEGLITNEEIKEQRSIAIADTARGFMPRSSGILPGQNVLTVSNFQEKIDAMLAGLGVGYLPILLAQDYIQAGKLVVKEVEQLPSKSKTLLSTAWRQNLMGNGVAWFIKKLKDKKVRRKILP